MSILPSPSKVAGSHFSVYEAYYSMVDPNNHGQIRALDAAKFLKKSHLSDVVLSKIWDISDPSSRGFLDKSGMFVALKLCALAQQGHNLNISNIFMDISPPKMGDTINTRKISPNTEVTQSMTNNSYWTISPPERAKYEQLFRSLEPVNGYISGNKVKGVLMDSKLPLETLGKIWDLADIDKDGKLDQHEFIIAMHLVYKALEKHTIPSVLPSELVDYSNKSATELSNKVYNPPPLTPSLFNQEAKTDQWIVSQDDQKAADKLFTQADDDKDGFVSGSEIKDIFFQSGLSQSVLAHIWALCDVTQNGKLNREQFALSMWFIKQKLNGMDLPANLTDEMIPPSLRKKFSDSVIENNNTCSYSNPELDMINKDIVDIIHEKHVIEQDISQKEADIKIKNGEIKSLQSELDTLAATLRQLDNQKGEAQKRLNDLKTQLEKLRQQASEQEVALRTQEDEINVKRQEIEGIKLAEQNLELQQHEYKNKINDFSKQLQNIQLQISQTKASITQLEEQQRQIVDAINQYDAAIAIGDPSIIPEASVVFKANLYDATCCLKNIDNEKKKDFFNNNEESNDENIPVLDRKSEKYNQHSNDASNAGFQSHPLKLSSDAFDAVGNKTYDPFNDRTNTDHSTTNISHAKDPFGEDPFAALHAPVRSESPSPALPPKKSKQPPPRPAPPRQAQYSQGLLQMSTSTSSSDPFADKTISAYTSNSALDFADFANFDAKLIPITDDIPKSETNQNVKVDVAVARKIPDFEEDPFSDYKYDDLLKLSDPFYGSIEK